MFYFQRFPSQKHFTWFTIRFFSHSRGDTTLTPENGGGDNQTGALKSKDMGMSKAANSSSVSVNSSGTNNGDDGSVGNPHGSKTSLSSSSSKKVDDFDWDSLYDEDDPEDDLGSVESHGSVLSHLLSQVKIGMDLTKVVLPTFILEKRSLLEMYADFFAHPDMFSEIADASTPKDRIVAVLRYIFA